MVCRYKIQKRNTYWGGAVISDQFKSIGPPFDIKINFDEESIINIYTIDGRILMSDMHTLGIDVLKIDSSNFKSGVYFISCEFQDVELVKKIIINK